MRSGTRTAPRASPAPGRAAVVLSLALLAACASGVSLEEEAELGAAFAAEARRELPLVEDPGVLAELSRIGGSLAAVADSTGRDYTFYLVDSPDVNAFAVPGGHVFVNRGLVEKADELAELAGVLGHEIAHVTERHGLEQVEKQRNVGLVLSLVYLVLGREPGLLEQVAIQGGGAAVFAKYGRDAEREADRRAVELLAAAGYHPEGMATFFEELMRQRQREPGPVEAWFASHPASEERVANARAAIRAAGLPAGERLVRDTPEYQRFRRAVLALP